MEAKLERQNGRESALSSINKAKDALDLARDVKGTKPAKDAFDSASLLLAAIRADCVELGFICADVCQALGRGLRGRRADQHSQSILDAIHQFNMTMAEIKGHVVKRGKRNAIAQRFHAKHDKEAVASWKLGLGKILSVFETELSINADVNDNQRGALDIQTLPSPVNANASASASAIYRDVFNTHGDKHAKNLPTYARSAIYTNHHPCV
ncbi:hypothetical protein BJ322DRAFT_881313 [Thelephora terrestris]|uniref:Fungal N-terminal domain-containing protein n=1 Tax=Thelephora terrestris TaxID=56493 RepID=A0A9P6HC80_9AGAM|nr:hypothetical protein BJ322DRAFT_881313 [Thelephora terrestris]